jgi:hypothetical protein
MSTYSVQPGDCCSRIASAQGLPDYHAVYDAAANAALRSAAPNPNQLPVGGTLELPDAPPPKQAPVSATHRFVISSHPVKLRLALVDSADQPVTGRAYTLTVGSQPAMTGSTNAQGLFEHVIDPAATDGTLVVRWPATPAPPPPAATPAAAPAAGAPPYPAPLDPAAFVDARDDAYVGGPAAAELTWQLHLGGLATFGQVEGVQGRLINLGVGRAPIGAAGDPLTAAVRLYQQRYHLTVDGGWESIKADVKNRHDQP